MSVDVWTSTSVLSNTTAPSCASTCQAPTGVTVVTVTASIVTASGVTTLTSVWTGRTGASNSVSTLKAASGAGVGLATHCQIKVGCHSSDCLLLISRADV